MFDDLFEFFMPLAVIMAMVFLLMIFVVILGSRYENYQCSEQWKDSGLNHRWSFVSGCMLEVNNRWIPSSAYKNIEGVK